MALTSDLTVVICHGSYHTPALHVPLVESLTAVGIDAYCPQLPTSDLTKLNVGDTSAPDYDRGPPDGGYPQGPEDTDAILRILKPLILEQGKRVLMVGHSSGGWVATEAARPELQEKVRKGQGLAGGIIGLFYIGAIIIPVGESVHSFFQPKDGSFMVPPFLEFHVRRRRYPPKTFFVAELTSWSLETRGGWASHSERRQDLIFQWPWAKSGAGMGRNSHCVSCLDYEALPYAYLVLEGDVTLPQDYQEGMVALQTQKTGNFTLYRCPAGHSPHLTWTDGTVGTMQEFIKKIEN